MLAQTLRRSLLEARGSLPPTFLLPLRARITTVTNSTSIETPEPLINSTIPNPTNKRYKEKAAAVRAARTAALKASEPSSPSPAEPVAEIAAELPSPTATYSPISDSVRSLLPLLKAQPPHYATIQIYGRNYLITRGDIIRLPFLMKEANPGDIIRLDKATHLGSREFTLRAGAPVRGSHEAPRIQPYLDERLFTCRAIVMGVESQPMRVVEKTKRRQRHVRHVKSKHKYTVIRITELTINDVDQIE